jgi:hypothetical protein
MGVSSFVGGLRHSDTFPERRNDSNGDFALGDYFFDVGQLWKPRFEVDVQYLIALSHA